ncbi:MAG: hypothetical protein HGA44_02175 [Cellulomonadaceae bacterium]|nr:hypothetical protein [Cellulomonadaceae bacterium]
MSIGAGQTTFFAYPGNPPLRAETMREVITGLKARGASAVGWEDLSVDGTLLVEAICARIDACDALVAEVSSMNPNVLFELGYAVARNKPTWLAFDDSDTQAEKLWSEIGIFATIGRTNYGGNSEVLINKYFTSPPDQSAPLAEELLSGAKPREANAVFAPSVPTKISPAAALEALLERQSHLKVLGSSEDLIIAPLQFYVREIYRSSAVILHLLGEQRRRAYEHNSRASFLAGFAHGLELPLLMVVQSGYQTPLDYRDLMYQYETSAGLQEKVKAWLGTLPKARGTQRRLGKLALDIELPIRSFGQYVAEYEIDELDDYFVQTAEFSEITSGGAQIFVGRKGTGKTATMAQVAKELAIDRRNLVVPIKPSSYDLAGLVGVLSRFGQPSHAEYFLMTAWIYLIYCEISLKVVELDRSRPAAIGDQDAVRDLEALLVRLGVEAEEDLSVRLERVIADVSARLGGNPDDHNAVAQAMRSDHLNRIRVLCQKALHGYHRIAILIDNLDKNWERGADFDAISHFILSLLVTSGKIEKEFQKTDGNGGLNATLALFLRTDIFDVVSANAREPDKIGARTVNWDDDQLLVRVLEERYAANRDRHRGSDAMWDELFCPEVRGLPTRDYFLWRALRRPRDFVYFANASLTTAINRRHSTVEPSDVVYAEKQYSRFAMEALLVEGEATNSGLEELLYEFAGLGSTLDADTLMDVLSPSADPAATRDWLIASSFLGLELREGEFAYVEGDTAAKRKYKVAERGAHGRDQAMRFRVHPAFRAYLEIQDDDLHE